MPQPLPTLKVLSLFLFLLIGGSRQGWSQAKNIYQQKPNIIWILSEDISTDLACYGTPVIKTPNLDKMAKDGIRYTNAFTTAPVCSPSRSALITGMYQTTIGAHNHRSHRKDGYRLPEPVKPITEYLRQAGYYTVLAKNPAPGVQSPLKTDFNFNPVNPVFDGNDWKERQPGQPFYAQMNMDESHRGKAWATTVQQHPPQIDPAKVVLPPFYPNHPVAREDWATYLESIQLVDSFVGKVLQRLQDEGIAENTLVIFSGDNGRCHIRDKQFLYDGGLHIPLIMKWPGQLKPGQTNTDLISAIDVSATILRVAGITPPKYLEGQVMLGPEAKKRAFVIGARDRMDETVDKMRAVRDKQFKYIKNYYPERPYMQPNKYKETQYPMWNLLKELHAQGKLTPAQALFAAPTKPAEELYDIVNDPYELNNLAASAKHQATLKKMRGILENWIKQTNDQGQYPEKPEAAKL
ncbi:sulfatase [Adhaeribacter aerolatus]|uniref:Sulfatase n=1 Tax=Adhaeribacter aerolatus TaxID=670289 RepID=A0A512B536_9BACT|nr:sulfatase [Adhaeribacter aerolatus]GEO07096.1 sulfatase [Adhaeribacter aerolatus]